MLISKRDSELIQSVKILTKSEFLIHSQFPVRCLPLLPRYAAFQTGTKSLFWQGIFTGESGNIWFFFIFNFVNSLLNSCFNDAVVFALHSHIGVVGIGGGTVR